jgi:hypothetical protein
MDSELFISAPDMDLILKTQVKLFNEGSEFADALYG